MNFAKDQERFWISAAFQLGTLPTKSGGKVTFRIAGYIPQSEDLSDVEVLAAFDSSAGTKYARAQWADLFAQVDWQKVSETRT